MRQRWNLVGLATFFMIGTTASAQAPPGGAPGAMPGMPGGFKPFEFPQPGQLLSTFLQDQLKLTPEQKKKLADFQKEADAQLAKLLTAEQQKSLKDMSTPPKFGFGGPGGPGGGPGGPGGGPGGPGGGPPKGFGGPKGGFGPPGLGFGGAPNEDVKKRIGATEEEWKVIGPKLQKLLAARRALLAEPGPMGGPFGGGAGAGILNQAQTELKNVLDDPKHTKADREEKIAAVRKARQQVRADVEAAQKDLILLLTPSQEVVMISMGYLE
jgi:hypothetical protein